MLRAPVFAAFAFLAAADQLNPAIGPPKPELYRAVIDAGDWWNPEIRFKERDEGIYVIARRGGVKDWKHIPVASLRGFLIDLPITAWPYGRVTLEHLNGGLAVATEDWVRREQQDRMRVDAILRDLKISVEIRLFRRV